MSIGRFYRSITEFAGFSHKQEELKKKNRAKSMKKRKPIRKTESLIYGQQGTFFDNRVERKPWQVGIYYDTKPNNGIPVVADGINYGKTRAGNFVNLEKNPSKRLPGWKALQKRLKKERIVARVTA